MPNNVSKKNLQDNEGKEQCNHVVQNKKSNINSFGMNHNNDMRNYKNSECGSECSKLRRDSDSYSSNSSISNNSIISNSNRGKHKQVQYFISKGTKIFHFIFKNSKSKNIHLLKKENLSKSISSLHNISATTLGKSLSADKWNDANETKGDSVNSLWDYTFEPNDILLSYNKSLQPGSEPNTQENEEENGKEECELNREFCDMYTTTNYTSKEYYPSEKNNTANCLQELLQDGLGGIDEYSIQNRMSTFHLEPSKNDSVSTTIEHPSISSEIVNRLKMRRQRKNLNKLFSSIIGTNGSQTNRREEISIEEQDQDMCELWKNTGIETKDPSLLSYDEINQMKRKAYEKYVHYIKCRRDPYMHLLSNQKYPIIRKILIANNGMAALKCILSLKEWLFKKFYDENLIKIVAMATEDDIRSNAKYISLSDQVIEVPSGKNVFNYANVELIVNIAKNEKVDAVWPGWGHCSENPQLSKMLEEENIIFLGPTETVMKALGDKISANILAQSVNVSVVKWSGDNIRINEVDQINSELYDKATVHTVEECIKECKRIGYPVMIKASQGGGGKGIRKVESEEEVKKAYEQVQSELPNSPIFLMKVCNNVRHIEIQVVGDMYGNVCSLSGRDCTTQRRFQKIFEEGPPLIVPKDIFREMEKASLRLTKMIKYRGAGTIEYLYDQIQQKYYFLELNPRLQVEHPVSEGITKTNIISIQLQIAMGIPLEQIEEIRKLYRIEDEKRKRNSIKGGVGVPLIKSGNLLNVISNTATEVHTNNNNHHNHNHNHNTMHVTSLLHGTNNNLTDITFFDFYKNEPFITDHVIAARITAENSNDSFKPTSGSVRKIHFQNSSEVWGYFSIDKGSVHEFSDSQIGHIFAKGATRELARKNLILTLRKLEIDGEIKTVTKYLAKVLESKEFIQNNITTNWLDRIIHNKTNVYYNTSHIIILCAIIFKIVRHYEEEKEKVEEYLTRGDVAIKAEKRRTGNLKGTKKKEIKTELVFEYVKYEFTGYNTGEDFYKLVINDQEIEVMAKYDKENDKIIANMKKQTFVYDCVEDNLGIHMNLGKDTVFLPKQQNPFHLISNTNGKIVRYLINNEEEIKKNDEYVEVEAMKMIMTFRSTESGILKHRKSAGSIIKIGDLLGEIEQMKELQKNKKEEVQIEPFKGQLDLSNKCAYELEDLLIKEEYITNPNQLLDISKWNNREASTKQHPSLHNTNNINNETGKEPKKGLHDLKKLTTKKNSRNNNILDGKQKKKNIFRIFSCKHIYESSIMPLHFPNDAKSGVKNEEKVVKESQSQVETIHSLHNRLHDNAETYVVSLDNSSYDENTATRTISSRFNNLSTNLSSVSMLHTFSNHDSENYFTDDYERGNTLMDVSTMKRIEFLLKGYEQNASECFKKLIRNENQHKEEEQSFYEKVQFILDRFMEYNMLFSKNEFVSEVEIYNILYEQVLDSKKQYEIIHAYMYNQGSIELVELIVSYLLEQNNYEFPPYLMDQIKKLQLLKGTRYGKIAHIVREISYVHEIMIIVRMVNNLLNYSKLDDLKKDKVNLFMKKHQWNISKVIDLISKNNYESVLRIFFKNNTNIHRFMPVLFTNKINCPFVEIYLKNLYSYFDVTTIKWIHNDLVKYTLRGSNHHNVLIINEKDRIDVQVLEELKKEHTFHIVNKSRCFMQNIQQTIKELLEICKKGYVYDYSGSARGEIYQWDKEKAEDSSQVFSLLPYEEHLFTFDEILKYYDITQLPEGKKTHTKLFLGKYKKDPKKQSLFAHREINMNYIKEQHILKTHRQVDLNEANQKKDHVHEQICKDLKESLCEIEIGRNGSCMEDPRISSYIIYSFIINDTDDIAYIKKLLICFLNTYNELFLQNCINQVLIRVFNKSETNNSSFKLQLERIFNLHVLYEHGKKVIEEIPEMPSFEIDDLYIKRKKARDADTVYTYDFIRLLDISLNRMNHQLNQSDCELFQYIMSIQEFKLDYISKKNPNEMLHYSFEENSKNTIIPKDETTLFENYDHCSDWEKKCKKGLFLSNRLEVGQNKMSLIGLLMTIQTDEYKEGREVVFIINDISTSGGSFSVSEDELFFAISSYARERKIPRIYISCNSGARIGLYTFLMDKMKIAWKNEEKKELGYEYIYITEEVKNQIPKEDSVLLKLHEEQNEKRYVLEGIVGNMKNPVGVENLRGSGLIAGETSKAYDQIFTLSYVTGRSVGIGAYLVRLGKRTIQKRGSSLLLTGFNALNKLLGENVYISNEQLGGIDIMKANGIAQVEVQNDQEGIDRVIKWLSYVPKTSVDFYNVIEECMIEKEKKEEIKSTKLTKNGYDNSTNRNRKELIDAWINGENKIKFHIHHIEDVDKESISQCSTIELIKGIDGKQGFLDKNSFFEYMSDWGKGIITGRGKLGTIPVGIIAVHQNMVHRRTPCDPALKTKSEKTAQAASVFFPDNSYKTAQAIEDFNKENLPLFVFSNWRGFSGGALDMFNSILKFGSMIVNQLVHYKHPVFVYIPVMGELRGGSWVVVDETLNEKIIEMYADTTSKGGILEATGIVEIKFRAPEIKKLMNNVDSLLIDLNKKLQNAKGEEIAKIKLEIEKKEKELIPYYLQICHKYADLHDLSTCMKSKGVIKKIVPWEKSRSFFYYRLLRKLLIHLLINKFSNSVVKAEEIEKIIEDICGNEEDDYEACKKIVHDNTLKKIKELSSELTYHNTLNYIYKSFNLLSPQQQTQIMSQINSYRG